MTTCPICSTLVLPTSEACETCGAPLVTKDDADSLPPTSHKEDEREGQGPRSPLRLLLAIPLALSASLFAFFGVLVGTAMGALLLVVAGVYFGLAGKVLLVRAPFAHTIWVLLGIVALILVVGLATMKAPW